MCVSSSGCPKWVCMFITGRLSVRVCLVKGKLRER